MADFNTHVTTSSLLGIGYGATGCYFGLPPESCVLAAGLCGLAGMLPDLDSDSGVPLRETLSFSAAVVPMMMIDRFQHMGLSLEQIVIAGGLVYLAIRFGVAEIFKHYTVHRGMWHSIPAAMIAAVLGFLICSCEDINVRLFKAGAVLAGFLSHLVLDEMYSFDVKRGKLHIKRSFGTALKFWSPNSGLANLSVYAKLAGLLVVAISDPILMERFGFHDNAVQHTARELLDRLFRQGESWLR